MRPRHSTHSRRPGVCSLKNSRDLVAMKHQPGRKGLGAKGTAIRKHAEPKTSRRGWSPEEDAALRAAVARYGTLSWSRVAQDVPARDHKSCRLRWVNELDPAVIRTDFEPWEDDFINRVCRTVGSCWSLMAEYLPGRCDNKIKNRWNTTLKRRSGDVCGPSTACGDGAHQREAIPRQGVAPDMIIEEEKLTVRLLSGLLAQNPEMAKDALFTARLEENERFQCELLRHLEAQKKRPRLQSARRAANGYSSPETDEPIISDESLPGRSDVHAAARGIEGIDFGGQDIFDQQEHLGPEHFIADGTEQGGMHHQAMDTALNDPLQLMAQQEIQAGTQLRGASCMPANRDMVEAFNCLRDGTPDPTTSGLCNGAGTVMNGIGNGTLPRPFDAINDVAIRQPGVHSRCVDPPAINGGHVATGFQSVPQIEDDRELPISWTADEDVSWNNAWQSV